MTQTIHKKQAWLDEVAVLVEKDLNKLHTLSQVRNLTDKENNMVSLCGAFLYLYKMAELKDFLNLTLSDDENEQPNNFETIH